MLDRSDGKVLLARPFVQKLTWASGVGPDGRPQLLPGNTPDENGVITCPAIRGATNWMSTSFSPATRLFYVMAVENCFLYRSTMFGGARGGGAAAPARGAGAPALPATRARAAPVYRSVFQVEGSIAAGPAVAGRWRCARSISIQAVSRGNSTSRNSNNYAGTLSRRQAWSSYGQASGESRLSMRSRARISGISDAGTWNPRR